MHAPTLRFALPAIVILAIIAVAIVAFVVVVHAHTGTAYNYPCC